MTIQQHTFGAGEINPRMEGRVDTAYPNTGLALAKNVLITGQGSVKRRPGTNYIATLADVKHIIPYTQDGVQYLIGFANLKIVFYDSNGTYLCETTTNTPWKYGSGFDDFKQICFAEHDGWIYLAHPSYELHRAKLSAISPSYTALCEKPATSANVAPFKGAIIQTKWLNTSAATRATIVASWRGRLILSGNPTRPTAIASPTLKFPSGSGVNILFGDQESYTDPYLRNSTGTPITVDVVTENCSFDYDLSTASGITQWIVAGKVLMQGTTKQEIVLQESAEGRINPNIYTQPMVRHEIHGHNGSTSRIAIAHTDGIFHINGDELKILTYSTEKQSYVSTSVSLHSKIKGPFRCAGMSTKPWTIIWLVAEDGTLYSFSYEPKNQVFAWAQHTTPNTTDTQAKYLSICVIRSGADEKIYLIVERDTGTYLELMRPIDPATQGEAACLDCAKTTTAGSPQTLSINMTHLSGGGKTYTVGIMADGGLEQPQIAGTNTVPSATIATAGIEFLSEAATCYLRRSNADESTVGLSVRPVEADLIVHQTLGIKVGLEDGTRHIVLGRDWSTPLGQAMAWVSGELKVDLDGTYKQNRLAIESTGALPFEIIGIKTTLKTGGQ
jgi:hypothetical protein